MNDNRNYKGIKEKIDEKEKFLIESISDKVADNINSSLSQCIGDIYDSLSKADDKSQGLTESLSSLSQNIQTLNEFDFSEQFTKVKNSQDALDKSSQDAKEIFDKSSEANKKLISDISEAIQNMMHIKNELSATEKKIDSNNSKIDKSSEDLLKVVETSGNELRELVSRLTVLSEKVEKDLKVITDKVNEYTSSDINSELKLIKQNNENALIKIEELENKCKVSPVTIGTAIIAGVILIINLISFFI